MAEDEPKKVKCPPGAPLWMCTFADMMSLLLCFFVLILSFATMDKVKFAKVSGSLKDAFGVQREQTFQVSPTGEMMLAPSFEMVPFDVRQELMEIVDAVEDSGLVETAEVKEGIIIRVKDQLAFASGQAKLQPKFKQLLNKIGKVIFEQEAKVVVSGHTDDVILKKDAPFKSNWALSAARAVAVVEYWNTKFKIPASHLSTAGYGAGQPIATNRNADGRAKNRRVEFLIKPTREGQAFKGLETMQ